MPRSQPIRTTRRVLLSQAGRALVGSGALVVFGTAPAQAQPFQPHWVQTQTFTELWSGPNRNAVSFGIVAEGSYFKVVGPPNGSRLYVWSPYSENYAYVDAAAVGPVDAPAAEALKPPAAVWVANHRPTTLWSGPDASALPLGQLDQFNPFELLGTVGPRFRVRDPRTGGQAFVDATAIGRVGPPPSPVPAPGRWWGSIGSSANLRGAPATEAMLPGELAQQTPVVVERWVAGQEVLPDQPTWGQLADGFFIYSPLLRPAPVEAPPVPPPGAPGEARWIDVNLTLQVAVAYEDRTPVYLARFSSGRPGWETSTGVFRILRRVASEIMDSTTLLGRDAARANYRLDGIKWTQYFTADGQAIHYNYWRDPALFGIPSSHGCLGMLERDARWFWDWAETGTPLVIHSA